MVNFKVGDEVRLPARPLCQDVCLYGGCAGELGIITYIDSDGWCTVEYHHGMCCFSPDDLVLIVKENETNEDDD